MAALVTAHGYDERPPVMPPDITDVERNRILARHAEDVEPKQQESSALLLKAISDAALHRMARKAGVEQMATAET